MGLSPENDGERVGTEPRAVVEAKLVELFRPC